MEELLIANKLSPTEIDKIVGELKDSGATSFPILREKARLRLVEEAKRYPFKLVDMVAGGVYQEAEACQSFHAGSLFIALRNEFQDFLERSLDQHPYLFRTPLDFDTLYLLRYGAGSIGITPHFDSPEYINLMGGFIFRGKGNFYICDDLDKANSKVLDTAPGNVILMIAPGFLPNSNRQCHYLDRVEADRESLWVRQSKWGGAYARLAA